MNNKSKDIHVDLNFSIIQNNYLAPWNEIYMSRQKDRFGVIGDSTDRTFYWYNRRLYQIGPSTRTYIGYLLKFTMLRYFCSVWRQMRFRNTWGGHNYQLSLSEAGIQT